MRDNRNTSYVLDVGLVISSPRTPPSEDVHPIYTLVFTMHLIARDKGMNGSSNECVGYTTIRITGCGQHNRSVGTAARRGGPARAADRLEGLPWRVLVAGECIPLLQTRVTVVVYWRTAQFVTDSHENAGRLTKATTGITATPSVLP